ncbi:polyprenyl synthetase family protein [Opitutales bacterium ASA1]|uniref:polyprenyl synthetase family protein n=1 Tax=Congregicoccus parvus TaxID=3081749 RepID=UPI002B2D604D|nr:polyprenyl synthetase family protein [Opitutales bacterium ASA1]
MPTLLHFKEKLASLRDQVESALGAMLPAPELAPARIHQAMRYSMEAGGKRLRPVLALAAADLFGRAADALPAAVAIECVHTYSLVHDDLPAMDDDDLRRGRPTCHRQFDEATAILAGDALLTHAFALIASAYAGRPPLALALVREFAHAAGSTRLIGGQMADMSAEGHERIAPEELEFIHRNKTAAMVELSLVAGGLCGDAETETLEALRRAGAGLGMAFQIVDDILDATRTSEQLGKTAGKDAAYGKATFVSVHGLDASRAAAKRCTDDALSALRSLPGDNSFLLGLASAMLERDA